GADHAVEQGAFLQGLHGQRSPSGTASNFASWIQQGDASASEQTGRRNPLRVLASATGRATSTRRGRLPRNDRRRRGVPGSIFFPGPRGLLPPPAAAPALLRARAEAIGFSPGAGSFFRPLSSPSPPLGGVGGRGEAERTAAPSAGIAGEIPGSAECGRT